MLGHLNAFNLIFSGGMYIPPENKGGSAVLARMTEAGHTGVRAGRGFYDYGDATAEQLFRERDAKLLKLKHFMKTLDEEENT